MDRGCEARNSTLVIGEQCRWLSMSTGNVISMRRTRRRAGQSGTTELVCALDHMLDIYKPEEDVKWSGGNSESVMMGVPCQCYSVSLGGEERQPLNITLKLFTDSISATELSSAIYTALSELSVARVEAIVLSLLTDSSDGGEGDADLPQVQQTLVSLWGVLERFQKEGVVQHLGVSDLPQSVFEAMFSNDQVCVKPSLIQINLNNCCSVPEDLRNFCRVRNVQILTHNDAQEILPEAVLTSVLRGRVTLPCPEQWRLRWSLRYLVMVQHTGVIKNKGYIVNIAR